MNEGNGQKPVNIGCSDEARLVPTQVNTERHPAYVVVKDMHQSPCISCCEIIICISPGDKNEHHPAYLILKDMRQPFSSTPRILL